jgi:hypothetical protein
VLLFDSPYRSLRFQVMCATRFANAGRIETARAFTAPNNAAATLSERQYRRVGNCSAGAKQKRRDCGNGNLNSTINIAKFDRIVGTFNPGSFGV